KKLKPGVHGVILSQGHRSATFLPQVWKQLPGKEQFLENLCIKGGLPRNAWKDSQTVIKLYEAEYFSE
ncbi:MAG: AMMECR1 domain-containing protein, partial [Deltaproteobacteria bacterium]|nr:AMMECR1 domain-containing protein [Deltaproteobacteria bacterium]